MKTLIFSIAIAMMMTLNLAAAPDGTKTSTSTKVEIFQTNPESVDVYIAKKAGELVQIKIFNESGTQLMTTRMKKQNVRYIRFYLNELPKGTYKICVEKDNETISSLDVSK